MASIQNYASIQEQGKQMKSPIPLSLRPAIHIQSVKLTISENQWNYRDKIPGLY